MLEWLEHVITDYLGAYGYPAVFVLMVLESACIPIPSEVTMVFGGFLVSRGDLDFVWVALVGTIANVIGSWLAYWVGYVGGRPLINRWGRYVLLREHELDRAHEWFERRGELAVFVSRLLPVIRTFISLPAGVARMNFWKFTLYTFLGCLPWTFALAWVGDQVGARWHEWKDALRFVDYAVIAAIVVGIVYLVIRWWRRRGQAEPATDVTAG